MDRRDLLKAGAGAAAALPTTLMASSAKAAPAGPVLAVISHPVKNYATWRAAYDGAETIREKAGVTGAEVFHDPKDANLIVVVHRFPSLEAMQGFLSDPALKETMMKGGVLAPPTSIVALAV